MDVIDRGTDLARWDDPKDLKAREGAEGTEESVAQPPAGHEKSRWIRSDSQWAVGEVVAFRLLSGKWTLLRTIGHHADKGGRSAICELLDSVTQEPAS